LTGADAKLLYIDRGRCRAKTSYGEQECLFASCLAPHLKPGIRWAARSGAIHAEVLGISVDGAWCHEAFAKDRRLHFPLLADFHPKGAAAKQYGAYREAEGVCERALFVIDRQGVIFWSYCSPIAVNPGADGILDALERLPEQGISDGHVKSSSHAA
jgi:hypothetical protein